MTNEERKQITMNTVFLFVLLIVGGILLAALLRERQEERRLERQDRLDLIRESRLTDGYARIREANHGGTSHLEKSKSRTVTERE